MPELPGYDRPGPSWRRRRVRPRRGPGPARRGRRRPRAQRARRRPARRRAVRHVRMRPQRGTAPVSAPRRRVPFSVSTRAAVPAACARVASRCACRIAVSASAATLTGLVAVGLRGTDASFGLGAYRSIAASCSPSVAATRSVASRRAWSMTVAPVGFSDGAGRPGFSSAGRRGGQELPHLLRRGAGAGAELAGLGGAAQRPRPRRWPGGAAPASRHLGVPASLHWRR